MSFTTYREQSRSYASTHCRSDALLAMKANNKRRFSKTNNIATRNWEKVLDVVLVVVWGASIPALMWLGALSGL